MTWSRAFAEAFALADGRTIKTLYEAGQLVLALPERHRANGHWQGAMERLLAAAEDPSEEALDRAARQFSIALRAEGLTPFRPAGKPRTGVACPRDSRGRLGNARRALRCPRRDALDVSAQGEGRRNDKRPLRFPDDGAQRRRRANPPQGHAGHFDEARRNRGLACGVDCGGLEAATAAARRCASDRRAGIERGWAAGGLVCPALTSRVDRQPAFRRGAFAGFASASVFPPAIGSSISRWPSTLAFGFFGLAALAGLPSSFAVSATTAARLLRNASIRSATARGGGTS